MPTKSPNEEGFSTSELEEKNKERKRSEDCMTQKEGRSLDPTKSLQVNSILENWRKRWETLQRQKLECTREQATPSRNLRSIRWIEVRGWMALREPIRDGPKKVTSTDVIFNASLNDAIRWANHLAPRHRGQPMTRHQRWAYYDWRRATYPLHGYFRALRILRDSFISCMRRVASVKIMPLPRFNFQRC